MSVIKYSTLLLVLFVTAIAAQDCRVSIQQQLRVDWLQNYVSYSLYDVQIENSGSVDIGSLTLSVDSSFVTYWELNNIEGNTYTLPDWRKTDGIPVNSTHLFGYIIASSSPATFTVVSCNAGDMTSPDPATDAPATSAPATDAPATDAPATDAPATDAPATDAPATDAPATDAPATDAPATSRPSREPRPTATSKPRPTATAQPSQEATAEPTNKPTKGATNAPTSKAATTAPTSKSATTAPTSKSATTAPTSKSATTAPTSKSATTAPTSKSATTAPTSKAGTTAPSAGGRVCPSGSWWAPAPQTTWQWQLTGTIDTSYNVQMYDIDLFDNTAATIQTLHNQGRAVICYFSTQYEDWRPDASSFTAAVKGKGLDGWAGENYVDIRSTVVRNIMSSRLDLALSKGCDGVEPDNVDGYESNTGFPLTAADQISFNSYIASEAHARGLSVGLKNDVDQASTLEPDFDWALNEQCNEYSECSTLNSFINKGKAVFNCEYSGSATSICPKMVTAKFSTIFKTLDLTAKINTQCCTSQSNGCAAVPYKCISSESARNNAAEVYAAKALEVNELTHEELITAAATTSYASIAFVVAASVFAALNV